MPKGCFITFESCEGLGKTTHVGLLSKWMKDRGIEHITTKEPGTPHINECKMIREFLLNPNNDIVPKSELFMFLADRAQHVERLIKPTLENGYHVICDRYMDSTKIYQCARGLSRQTIDILLEFTIDNIKPDMTFVLDAPVEIGLKRARASSKYKGGDRMERENIQFHEAIRHGFLKLSESISEHRFRVIDVSPPKTIEETHEEIVTYVSKQLFVSDLG